MPIKIPAQTEPFLDASGRVAFGWYSFLRLLSAQKLDELASPTDVTTLDATTSAHGLLPKLSGNAAHTLKGDGTWS